MKVACIVGVRPEFIQVEPVINELKEHDVILIHTGQHYDFEMSKIFFDDLKIPDPDYYLNVGSGSPGHQTGEMLKKVEDVLLKEMPNYVLVFGDTNSTLAGALAASKLNICVGHVEAGLRSFYRSMPEEINRVVVDHISDILFAPTNTAVMNLNREGISNFVYNVGDVLYDSLLQKLDFVKNNQIIISELELEPKKYFLLTLHRFENTARIENLKNILSAIGESQKQFIFPIHPRSQKFIKRYSLSSLLGKYDNIRIIRPLGYINFLRLLYGSKKILTDSGGVQKQAFMLGIPCITLREHTEWTETVENGWNVLVGADKDNIKEMIDSFNPQKNRLNVYGDGLASKKIVELLSQFKSNREELL